MKQHKNQKRRARALQYSPRSHSGNARWVSQGGEANEVPVGERGRAANSQKRTLMFTYMRTFASTDDHFHQEKGNTANQAKNCLPRCRNMDTEHGKGPLCSGAAAAPAESASINNLDRFGDDVRRGREERDWHLRCDRGRELDGNRPRYF
jgi:hypothetical protein